MWQIRIREIQGAICVASVVQVIIGFFGKYSCVGLWKRSSGQRTRLPFLMRVFFFLIIYFQHPVVYKVQKFTSDGDVCEYI